MQNKTKSPVKEAKRIKEKKDVKVEDLFVGVGKWESKNGGRGSQDTLYTWMELSKNNKTYAPKPLLLESLNFSF